MNCLLSKKTLYPLTLSIWLFFGLMCFGATTYDDDVSVYESSAAGVSFTYKVPEAEFSRFDIGDKVFYNIEIARTAQIRQEGFAQIPMKIVSLAVPPGATVAIRVIDSEYKNVEFRQIAPFFARESEEEFIKAYSSPAASRPQLPPSWPYAAVREQIRGLNTVKIAIPTARYDPQSGALSLLRSETVRVDFTGGEVRVAAYRDPGPAFDRIFRKVIANYDAGREWFMPRESGITARATTTAAVFDSSDTWVKIELVTEGIYKFGWLEFNAAGIEPLSVDPSQVRVFYGGGRELPVSNFDPRPQMVEIPIEILGGGDGTFDNGDYVVFYADAVDSWEYADSLGRYLHYRNHYTGRNVYWLTTGGSFSSPPERLASVDGSPIGSYDVSVDAYRAQYHKEEEFIFFRPSPTQELLDYFDWYWGFGKEFRPTVQLFDMVPGEDARVVVRHRLGSPSLRVNGGTLIPPSTNQYFSTYITGDLSSGLNSLELYSTSDFFLDYIDIDYSRWLKTIDEVLLFVQPDTGGVISYNLTDVASPYILLDITDKDNPVKITGGRLQGQDLEFYDSVSVDMHKQYYISSISRLKSPSAVSFYAPDDLRDTTSPDNRADEIIITYDGFYDQAEILAQHRRDYYNMPTRVVRISDVFNQFSYGLVDAVAIRDFLKYAFENWPAPAPTFALLLGDGHFDYRDNLGAGHTEFIPPFENDHIPSDEHFIYFGRQYYLDSDSSGAPDMMIGRIPANSVSDAEDMIGKTIDYDASPDLGSWRNRIVIAADDNTTPRTSHETFHTMQAEALANQHVPVKFEVNKIYMVEYPMRNYEKPEAREALINAFNQGCLIVDWIGHGSPDLWADEHIFRRTEDIPRLVNGKKLPLVFTASCSIGFFDDPAIESFGEELIRNRSRGSVAVISATRAVLASPNTQFNNKVYDELLYQDSVGIGEGMYVAKYLRQIGGLQPNDRYYVLFGDPSQLLQFPKFDVEFTDAPDSLVALSEDRVSGRIVDNDGNLMSGFNGTVQITVKDGSIVRSIVMRDRNNNPLDPPNNTISFISPGATIFTGPVDVTNGLFSSEFFIPKDVSYGSQGARIYAYGENGTYDAVGVVDSILVSGSIPAVEDSTGPEIRLYADGREFVPGATLVGSGFTLMAEISDEHGINITGQLGHGIVVKIDDGDLYEADVTGNFRFNRGDYRAGSLQTPMPAIPLGEHVITLKAWDNFNNSTLITKTIEVISTENLRLFDVMNYPNPIRKADNMTTFQYCLSEVADRVSIKIFTEAGFRIRTIDLSSPSFTGIDCHRFDWNLRDADGDPLANGVYIYRVEATGMDASGKRVRADESRKLVILR